MVSRRAMFVAPLAFAAARAVSVSAARKMTPSLHQNTSGGAGYRGSLEGWARAGIKNVELTNTLLDGFLKTGKVASFLSVKVPQTFHIVHADPDGHATKLEHVSEDDKRHAEKDVPLSATGSNKWVSRNPKVKQ